MPQYGGGQVTSAANLSARELAGKLVFRCPKTGSDFISGFLANQTSLRHIGSQKLRLRCRVCGEHHNYAFAQAKIQSHPDGYLYG